MGQRLVDSLKIYTKKEVFFIPFILDLNNYNFCSEKKKIDPILPGDIDESFFTEGLQIFDTKKDQLNSYVNRDFFRNHLRSKHFNSEEVGILSDTKIEPELLDKIFYKKYPHSLNLEVNEEEIINFSKYFLENDSLKKIFMTQKIIPLNMRKLSMKFNLNKKNMKRKIKLVSITYFQYKKTSYLC